MLDGSDWTLKLFPSDGSTPIDTGTVGTVGVTTGGVVALPLDLRALGGEPAHELRVHGAGTLKIIPAQPLSAAFPVSEVTVAAGEVLGIQIEKIISITGCTAIRIAWGGDQ